MQCACRLAPQMWCKSSPTMHPIVATWVACLRRNFPPLYGLHVQVIALTCSWRTLASYDGWRRWSGKQSPLSPSSQWRWKCLLCLESIAPWSWRSPLPPGLPIYGSSWSTYMRWGRLYAKPWCPPYGMNGMTTNRKRPRPCNDCASMRVFGSR